MAHAAVSQLDIIIFQLQMYKERYEEFQSTISKSEEMFQKFKTEMEKVKKKSILIGWCFGFNGPLRQYFSLYRAVSQREEERGEKE